MLLRKTYKLWGFSFSDYYSLGKGGINAIGGLEYKFGNIPLSLQFDFRPGCGIYFNNTGSIFSFDWTLGLGVKYTF